MPFTISKKYTEADPRKLADWQIADIAEENMPTVEQAQEMLGLKKEEIIPMGRLCRLDFIKIMERLKEQTRWEVRRGYGYYPYSLRRRKDNDFHGFIRGIRQKGKECWWLYSPAFGWSNNEY